MKLEADIRLVVTVPFNASAGSAEERVAAAVHAETDLVERLAKKLAGRGISVKSALVEEVREA